MPIDEFVLWLVIVAAVKQYVPGNGNFKSTHDTIVLAKDKQLFYTVPLNKPVLGTWFNH